MKMFVQIFWHHFLLLHLNTFPYPQQLVLQQDIIEWDLINGVHTGSVQKDFRDKIGNGGSPIIEIDDALDKSLVEGCVDFMKLVEEIPAELRLKFIENFKSDRTISKMSEKELIFFFGRPQDQKKPSGLFGKLQEWLLK